MRYSFIFIICFFISCSTKNDTPKTIHLNNNWSFKNIDDTIWNPAIIPGNIYTDLLNNKRIENPFISNNELKLQWVSEKDWEYKTEFSIDSEMLQKKNIELHFDGLDTYATVFLNDSLILKSNNAFRQFNVDVKSILEKENVLKIVFENTSKYEEVKKNKLAYKLPEGNRIFTRKAQFQYGWDWAPKLNASGIWRTINVSAWNDLKIVDVFIKQKELNDSIALLIANLEVKTDRHQELIIDVYVNDVLTTKNKTSANNGSLIIPFQIKNPTLWWPHNLGEPFLYQIKFIVKQNNKVLDSFHLKKGLRNIELVTEKDSIGESFYFKVNDIPVYAKGANYIPQNSLQNQVTDSHYEKLLEDVVKANMNMLRVWGGGIYENDIFYDLCDEKGIMVWQDFMFACAMYPGDEGFLANVRNEAIDNIKRLRNHASIALWCGNNENSEGWHRWGWKDGKTENQQEEIWNNYLKIFDSILPRTVDKLTDKTSYWESSPKYGRGNPKYINEGDAHDWWIWHDGYPFEHLEENVPRYMSEFGFQSFPSYDVVRFINQKDSMDIFSEGFLTHQKHSRGFQLINEYMERDFPVPQKAEDYIYVSQLLQAYGITKGIEAHRRAKPYNMGTLYWQLNDCWPAVSWSSIDFFGNWKALHYKAKQTFKNVLISSEIEKDTLKVFIVNDNLKTQKGNFSIQILNFSGQIIWEDSTQVEVKPNTSELKYKLNLKSLKFNKNEVVVVSKFNDEWSYFYLAKPKELLLKKEPIQKKIVKTSNGFTIELSSVTLQKNVFLYCKEKGHFFDNYFDLIPNQIKTVEFKTKEDSLNTIKIITLNSI